MRLDSRLQECQEAHWKRSFPDLDYAFFGYDVLKGYPLASGHDPGFTHPIFLSTYSSGKQTSDCRYSVPEGLIVVPDVSCVTSFSSKVIRNKVEMSSSLSVAANIEGASPRKCSLLGVTWPANVDIFPAVASLRQSDSDKRQATKRQPVTRPGSHARIYWAHINLESFLRQKRVVKNLDLRHRA